jgi:SAM-dependent methyltransferase
MPTSTDSPAPLMPPPLSLHEADSADAFARMFRERDSLLGPGPDLASLPHTEKTFTVPGFCWVDQAHVEFAMDDLYSEQREGATVFNWRERMVCPKCGLNNRVRGAVHVFEIACAVAPSAALWLTERLSPLYAIVKARYPGTIGSEYLGDDAQPGSVNGHGVRHESLTRPSFAPGSLDAILSFDVFEHIPDVHAAFRQCARILKPSGQLLFSVPFLPLDSVTRLRAEHAPDGSIRHILPAVYHGDPVNPAEGILCYREFGWDVLDGLKAAGFRHARCLWYASSSYGYVGGPFQLFIATR